MSFVVIDVPDTVIAKAQQMRLERDQLYPNIYPVASTDMRWVGEIGEIIFDSWLHQHTSLSITWITDEASGKPDFVVGSSAIGVKTVKRKVGVRPDYTAQITAKHASEPSDFFFFTSYEFPVKKLWLLGGISKASFLKEAIYYRAGDWVHANYQVRPGHEIYNIAVEHLTSPLNWLSALS